jgi:hypothetical protein
MFMSNPFAELSAQIPVAVMQGYIILMVLLVVRRNHTRHDAQEEREILFPECAKSQEENAKREVGAGEKTAIATKVLVNEVATSGEFCNIRRRLSHLLTMWGFVIFVATTAILIFGYPTPATPAPAILPQLWHIGALMLAVGGYWFWFFIRVDVSAEGLTWWRLERADLFILSLLATATFALIWSYTQFNGMAGWSTLFLILFAAFRHRAVRWRVLVEVRPHVLQARCRFPEARHPLPMARGKVCRRLRSDDP